MLRLLLLTLLLCLRVQPGLPVEDQLKPRIFQNQGTYVDTVGLIKFAAYSVVANLVVGFGLIGNLLNLIVLTRPNLKGVMYVYLLGLAVSNLLVLVSALPGLYDISSGLEDGKYSTAFYQAHMKLPIINSFMASSVYIIICMTVNRYISIYKPTHFQRIHTHKNARISIFASFVGGILVHIPLCFQNTVVQNCPCGDGSNSTDISTVNSSNSSGEACAWQSDENFDISENIVFKVYLVLSEIILRVGPIITLAILNALIIHKFLKIAKKRQVLKGYVSKPEVSHHLSSTASSPQPSRNTSSTTQSSSASSGPSFSSGPRLLVPGSGPSRSSSPEPSSCTPDCTPSHAAAAVPRRRSRRKPRSLQNAEERMLVLVLISIVVLFVCCTTPAAVLSVLFSVKFDKHLGFQIFRAVANDLELLNFALNFYIYCLCSAEIRRAFVSVFDDIIRVLSMRKFSGGRETITVQIDHV